MNFHGMIRHCQISHIDPLLLIDLCVTCLTVVNSSKLFINLVYDVQIAIADVVAYMKHQIRDAQQKQAKAMAINLIDEE